MIYLKVGGQMNEELRASVEIVEKEKQRICAEDTQQAMQVLIDLATQVLNASEVMPKEKAVDFDPKDYEGQVLSARDFGYNQAIQEATLAHTKLMLAKEEITKKYSNKLQGELQKNESLEQQISKLQWEVGKLEHGEAYSNKDISDLKEENEKLRTEIARHGYGSDKNVGGK